MATLGKMGGDESAGTRRDMGMIDWPLVSFLSFGRWCPFCRLAVGDVFVVWPLVSFLSFGRWCPFCRVAVGDLCVALLIKIQGNSETILGL